MNQNRDTKRVLILITKIIVFLAFMNFVAYMIIKGVKKSPGLRKAVKKLAKEKKAALRKAHEQEDCCCEENEDCCCEEDEDCCCEEDEDCCCDEDEDCCCEEVEVDDGCDGYCLEDEVEDTETELPDTTSNIRCRNGEGCTNEDPYLVEEKKPE